MIKNQLQVFVLDEALAILLIKLEGFIDHSNSSHLEELLDLLYDKGNTKLILDMNSLEYMSSAGWGTILGEVKRFRERNGDLKIVNMHDPIRDVFQILELYHVITDYDSIQNGLRAFNPDIAHTGTLSEPDEKGLSEQSAHDRTEKYSIQLQDRDKDTFDSRRTKHLYTQKKIQMMANNFMT